MRFLEQPRAKITGSSSSSRVTSYLQTLYESVAETLPDFRDDPGIKCELLTGLSPMSDSYGDSLSGRAALGFSKKSRMYKKGVRVHDERRPEESGREVRFLPPGVMKDHWEAMASFDPLGKVSFGCFWSTWIREFPHLRFRSTTSHTQCSQCLHYKLLIRGLTNHMAARQRQSQLLVDHLMAQYRDRQAYWEMRGSSRLGCSSTVCCILDGMDQCKFLYPRSPLCLSKDLAGMQRPKLHVTGAIIHGWGLAFTLSHHDHPKDASASVEILAHLLTRMHQSGINLQRCNLVVQCDNTARELKNGTTLRFLSALVSHHIVESCTLSHLRSGHSHEDIDQAFGSLALYIVRHCKEAQTPKDFFKTVSKFADSAQRPHEPHRVTFQMDSHRDWKFDWIYYYIFFVGQLI